MNRASLNVCLHLSNVYSRLPINIPKRWAGHSKWQNIKSTKEAMDRQRSVNFQRISRKIRLACMEGCNPSTNSKLKSAMEEAKKFMMPKETIQNILKSISSKEDTDPYWLFYSDINGIILGFEVISANSKNAIATLNQYLKKIRFKHEKNVDSLFNVKGLIISEPLQNIQNSYEKAIEDGIEAGVAEVTQDDSNMIYFECDPQFLQGSSKKLSLLGYNIQSATTEIEFFKFIKISNDEKTKIDEVLKKLQANFFDLIRIVNNIDQETQNV